MKKLIPALLITVLCLCFANAESPVDFGRAFPKETRVLDLSGEVDINMDELTSLMDKLPDLLEVHMFDADISAEALDILRAHYPDVFFGVTFKLQDHVVRTDQTAFSTLHNNKVPRHSSSDFAFLRHCVRLEALDLGHNAIDDISFVENLTEIKVLILALNQIEDISPLKNLKKVEYLEIFRNKIRDMSPLEGMENLLDLNIGYNNISDYTPLMSLTKLERLWLYQSNGYSKGAMDKNVLKEIRGWLPDCEVNGVSAGTGGGWREHPHYDVIFDVFKTSVYKPFDIKP